MLNNFVYIVYSKVIYIYIIQQGIPTMRHVKFMMKNGVKRNSNIIFPKTLFVPMFVKNLIRDR